MSDSRGSGHVLKFHCEAPLWTALLGARLLSKTQIVSTLLFVFAVLNICVWINFLCTNEVQFIFPVCETANIISVLFNSYPQTSKVVFVVENLRTEIGFSYS